MGPRAVEGATSLVKFMVIFISIIRAFVLFYRRALVATVNLSFRQIAVCTFFKQDLAQEMDDEDCIESDMQFMEADREELRRLSA